MRGKRSSLVGCLALFTLLVAAVSCSDSVAPTATSPGLAENEPPGSEVMGFMFFDCTLGTSRCATILEGIELLETHWDPACQQAGSTARGRFFGDYGGFHDGSGSGGDMYVLMHSAPSWSGYWPSDGVTHVNESLWNKLGGNYITLSDIAGLIAHEEMHQEGWIHGAQSHDIAIEARQSTCSTM